MVTHMQEAENASGFQKLVVKAKRFMYPRALPSDLSSIDMEKIIQGLKDKKYGQK